MHLLAMSPRDLPSCWTEDLEGTKSRSLKRRPHPRRALRTTPFPSLCVTWCVYLDGTTLPIADDFGNAGKGKRFRPVSFDRDKIEDNCTVHP
jgi:hypothetical protein